MYCHRVEPSVADADSLILGRRITAGCEPSTGRRATGPASSDAAPRLSSARAPASQAGVNVVPFDEGSS